MYGRPLIVALFAFFLAVGAAAMGYLLLQREPSPPAIASPAAQVASPAAPPAAPAPIAAPNTPPGDRARARGLPR